MIINIINFDPYSYLVKDYFYIADNSSETSMIRCHKVLQVVEADSWSITTDKELITGKIITVCGIAHNFEIFNRRRTFGVSEPVTLDHLCIKCMV